MSSVPPPAGQPPNGQQPGPSGQQPGQQPYGPPQPGQPPYGQPPPGGYPPQQQWGQQPPPEPPKKKNWFLRHKILSTILAIIGISVLASALGGGGADPTAPAAGGAADSSTTTGTKAAPPAKTTKAAPPKPKSQLGTKVRDGKFEFTVTRVKCGRTRVGSSDFGEKAQGEFCEINLTVENIGDEPQSLFGDNQVLYDARGRKFSPDTGAAIYLDDSNSLIEEINPGNTVKGILLYDVPKGTKPVSLELHDSAFSEGVKVTL